MNEEQLKRIWIALLGKRGLADFKDITVKGKTYLRTNCEITEPDGSKRTEAWVVATKDSISPFDIVNYNDFVSKSDFDYGVLLTSGTLTASGVHVLNESAPFVRVYDHTKFIDLLGQSPEIAKEYDIEVEETLPEMPAVLLERLEQCPPGKERWEEYQDLVEEIFRHLFVPPLSKPEPQSRSDDGLDIMDVVFPNHVGSGFWAEVKAEYEGSYIVVEAKNKESCDKNDVIQLGNYLNKRHLGLFGILSSRGISRPAEEERRAAYSNLNRMIILINDEDIREMILKKARKEDPEDVLRDRIDLYRMKYRF